jgi:primosomal protein N' (replication factor Y)
VQNPGLIVDEEHDGSYKQKESRYNGRDVPCARAGRRVRGTGSATPSLESRYNAEKGKDTLLELPGRIESRPCPWWNSSTCGEFLETRKQDIFSRKRSRR